MALYVAEGLEEGRLDYLAFFSIARYASLKDPVDAMLTADGFQNLIVPIV